MNWSHDSRTDPPKAGAVFRRPKVRAVMSAQPSFAFRQSSLPSSGAAPTRHPESRSLADSPGEAGEREERRRYLRLPLRLRGRYMLEDGSEFPCEALDFSLIGIGIRGFAAGAVGDRV